MKRCILSVYVFFGCFVLRTISDYSKLFGWDEGVDDNLYHPTPLVKVITEAVTVLVDMIFMIPIALLIYHILGEKNKYRALITLFSSLAIYDVVFHIIKMF